MAKRAKPSGHLIRPTIAQLEQLMNDPEQELEILPDGSVRVLPLDPDRPDKLLTFRSDLGGEYGRL